MNFLDALQKCPLIPILRGITPDEVIPIGEALLDAGFACIEVPINSPDAPNSIGRLIDAFSQKAIIGAGTVTTFDEVEILLQLGARLVVMPHADPLIIQRAKEKGLYCVPGFSTPTEAFAAIHAGADALKLFPTPSPNTLKALKVVLPADIPIFPVGGIVLENMPLYWNAGASGFGLGSSLYQPGDAVSAVAKKAKEFCNAIRNLS